ncbi:hypothetical protein LCGC14_2605820, partial [marine sediment metagenome]
MKRMAKILSHTGDDLIKLYFTENVVNKNETKITITKIDLADITGLEGRDKFVSDAFDIRPKNQKFSYPVQLTLKYDINNIVNLKGSEKRLAIYRFHEASNQWYELPSTVCTTSKTVSTNINHFSVYTIKMRPENSDISVKIYTY